MTDTRLGNYWRLSLLSTGSALLIALLLLLGYHAHNLREGLQNNLTMQARLLGANLTAAIVFEDSRTAAEIIGTATALEAATYRANGSLMAHFQRPDTEARFGEGAAPDGHVFSFTDLQLALPVELEGRVVGSIALRASLNDLYGELGRLFGSMLLILTVSALLGTYVSRKMRLRMIAAENEIERLALFDRVTGLANRHALELGLSQTLQRHARSGGGSALLYIDVDGFKAVNDQFGHPVGDAVLKAIGERLGKALRGADIVARIGGDEFAVILTGTANPAHAICVAEKLVRIAAEPFATDGGPAHIGFSVGICMVPQDAADVERALQNADLAMYRAKQMGKNTYQMFSGDIENRVEQGLDIEGEPRPDSRYDGSRVANQP